MTRTSRSQMFYCKYKKLLRFLLLLFVIYYFINKEASNERNTYFNYFPLHSFHNQSHIEQRKTVKRVIAKSFEMMNSQNLKQYVTENGKDEIIWFTTANENYAKIYLPMFLDSFRLWNDTLASKFLVITFSKSAQSICLKVHHLCPIFVETLSGELTSKLNYSARQGDQSHWRNFVWTTVEARLHVLRQGYSYIHIDCDVFHMNDPWELVKNYLGEQTWISSNSMQAKLSDANPGIQYVHSGRTSLAYVKTWFAQRSKMGTSSGNQRALTTLLAKNNKMSSYTKLYPCSVVSNACCLRECCFTVWEKLDEMTPMELFSEISGNKKLKWLNESVMFHAACIGGTPRKKLRRYEKIYAAFELRAKT